MSDYYDWNKTLSYDADVTMVVGARGIGKTYGLRLQFIRDWIKDGSRFVELVRHKNELSDFSATYFNRIEENDEFPDYVFKTNSLVADTDAESIAQNAFNYLGYSYSYGSAGPNSFDCSGFTSYLYKQQGYSIPRTSRDQGNYGTYVEKTELVPGDLVFFSNRSDKTINHVGVYVGNGEFIHASTSTRGVVKDSLSSNYYTNHYITARRIL